MHPKFAALIDSLEPKRLALLEMKPVQYPSLPTTMPARGVYLFSDGERHLYVGRTNTLRKRLGGHCRPSASHATASFAFRRTREETGNHKATYKAEGSRAALMQDATFAATFTTAKEWLATLERRGRVVESAHDVRTIAQPEELLPQPRQVATLAVRIVTREVGGRVRCPPRLRRGAPAPSSEQRAESGGPGGPAPAHQRPACWTPSATG